MARQETQKKTQGNLLGKSLDTQIFKRCIQMKEKNNQE